MGVFTTVVISVFVLLMGLGVLIFGIYWLRSDEMTPRLRSYIVEEDVTSRKGVPLGAHCRGRVHGHAV